MEDLRPAVIEQPGPPCGMPAFAAGQEILLIRSVLQLQSFPDVRAGMAVHDIQQHTYSGPVGLVDQVFQVIRLAVPVRCGKEVRYLVSERSVIRMLLYRHQLDGVVAQVQDARNDIVREFPVGTDSLPVLCHADMRLVDQRGFRLFFHKLRVCPRICFLRVPYPRTQRMALFVHAHPGAVCRQALKPVLSLPDPQLGILAVLQGVLSLQRNFPYAVVPACQRMAFPVPVVEVADQAHFIRTGHPFPEYPAGPGPMESKKQVAVRKPGKRLRVFCDLLPFLFEPVHPELNIPRIRFQPGINPDDFIGGLQLLNIHLPPPCLTVRCCRSGHTSAFRSVPLWNCKYTVPRHSRRGSSLLFRPFPGRSG